MISLKIMNEYIIIRSQACSIVVKRRHSKVKVGGPNFVQTN